MSTVIKQSRLIDPANERDMICDIRINNDGIIEQIADQISASVTDTTIDAKGHWVIPGLIDLASRLREPGEEHKGTIASETLAAVAGGVTTVCMPPDTSPTIDDPSVAELILRRNRDANHARVIPLGALTHGLAGEQLTEVALLHDAGCIALSDGGKPVRNSRVLRRALDYALSFNVPVMLTPDDVELSTNGCAHEGTVATRLGLNGIPTAAETVAIGRYIALAHETQSRVHICRLSSRQSLVFLDTAKAHGLKMTSDVAIHQLFLTEMDIAEFDSTCHVKPPLRRIEDREALRQGIASGTIQAITSDHQPHDADAKLSPFPSTDPGISGVQTLLPLVLRLVEENLISLSHAIELVTYAPASILGIDRGHLGIGACADLCIVDPEFVWQPSRSPWYSTGRNSPFMEWEFSGKVMQTFVQGREVFKHQL